MSDAIKLIYPAMDTPEKLDKVIAGAIEAAKTMKKKVQYAAIGCMILSAKDSDLAIEKANYLVDQLGAGVKGEGLVKYMVQVCGFEINEAARDEGFTRTKGEDFVRSQLEKAKAKPWWDFAPATPFKGFNLLEEINRVLDRAEKMREMAEKDETKAEQISVDVDMLETMSALLGGKPVKHKNALQLVEKLIPDTPLEDEKDAPQAKAA